MRSAIKTTGIVVGLLISSASIALNIFQMTMIWGYQIPLNILSGVGFVLFVGFMGWTLFDYRNRIKTLENAQPNIVFDEIHEAPLFRNNKPIYHILQVWFKNKPISPLEQSIAGKVTAIVDFWDGDYLNQPSRIYAPWAIRGYAPTFVGHKEISPEIDIPPITFPINSMSL